MYLYQDQNWQLVLFSNKDLHVFFFSQENKIWNFLHIISRGDNLCENVNPYILFLKKKKKKKNRKKEKIFQNVTCWNFYLAFKVLNKIF